MQNVVRVEQAEQRGEHESRAARFGPLVVAYFVRAIESLNELPRGPELATRRVWSREIPASVPTATRRQHWD